MTSRDAPTTPGTSSRQAVLLVIAILFLARGLRWSGGDSVSTPARPIHEPITKIDINHCDVAELSLLPGVGPQLAEEILRYRTQQGPFQSVGDLAQVPRIGPKMIEQLEPYVDLVPVR